MPLDPSIPEQVQMPPAPRLPSQAIANGLRLRDAQLQLDEQEQARAEKDAVQRALAQYPNDPDAAIRAIAQTHPGAALALRSKLAETRKTIVEEQKVRAEASIKAAEAAARVFQGVQDEPGFQRARSWAVQLDESLDQLLPRAYSPQAVQAVVTQAEATKDYLDRQRKALEEFQKGDPQKALGSILAASPNQQAWDAAIQSARALGVPEEVIALFPAQWSPAAQQRAAQLSMTEEQRSERKVAEGQLRVSEGNLRVAQGNLSQRQTEWRETKQAGQLAGVDVPPGVEGEAALEGLPEAEKAIIRKIASYDFPLPGAFALRSPQWVARLQRVMLYDPTFSAPQYPTRVALKRSFNSGKPADNIRSLNTAIGHLAHLDAAIDKHGNWGWKAANEYVGNPLAKQAGSASLAALEGSLTAVVDELATLFKGTSGTDEQIKAWRQGFDIDAPPSAQKAAVRNALELAFSRLKALESQYETGMGKPRDFRIINAESIKNLKKLGVDVTQWEPGLAAPSAAPPKAPTAGPKADPLGIR